MYAEPCVQAAPVGASRGWRFAGHTIACLYDHLCFDGSFSKSPDFFSDFEGDKSSVSFNDRELEFGLLLRARWSGGTVLLYHIPEIGLRIPIFLF